MQDVQKQVPVQLLLLLRLQSHSNLQSFISPNKLPHPNVWLRMGCIRWYFSTGFCGPAKGVLKKAWSQVSYRFIMAFAFTRLLLFAVAQLIHLDWLLSSPAVEQSQRPRQPWPGISHCSDICYSTMTSQTYQNGWALYRCFFAWTTSIYRCRHPNCIIAE